LRGRLVPRHGWRVAVVERVYIGIVAGTVTNVSTVNGTASGTVGPVAVTSAPRWDVAM
jgi:hypothetical protein